MGIDETTDFRCCSLLPWFKKQDVADNLLSILSTRGERSLIDGLVVPIGRPSYVKGRDPKEQSKRATSL